MKLLGRIALMLWTGSVFADPLLPVVAINQNLVAVDYFRAGQQSGCGLRVTGETTEDIWLNVLVDVLMKESGETFGIFKVAAKRLNKEQVDDLLRDGKASYVSYGKIYKAWIKTSSGIEPRFYKNGETSHNDGYMATMEFGSTMNLLVAIAQSSITVGFSRDPSGSDEIFEFSARMEQKEVEKLFTCMKNLRREIAEYKGKNDF